MADHEFRVTVEDLATGERTVMEIANGDYVLIPFAPCYQDSVQAYPLEGTHVITMRGHRPALKPRVVPTDTQAGGDETCGPDVGYLLATEQDLAQRVLRRQPVHRTAAAAAADRADIDAQTDPADRAVRGELSVYALTPVREATS